MTDLKLTAEQEAEAQRLAAIIVQKTTAEALPMARLLVSQPDRDVLGATEFVIRERVHQIGALAIETAVNQRNTGGAPVRA